MGVWDVWCKGDEDLSWARDRVIFYFLFVVVLVIEFLGVWGDFFWGGIRILIVLFCYLSFWLFLHLCA